MASHNQIILSLHSVTRGSQDQIGTFWKPFSTKYGSFWHANFGVDPKLAETAPLLYRATDVPFLPKMEQEPKLAETVFYQVWHISN